MRVAILLAVPALMGLAPAAQPLPLDMPGYSRPAPPATGDLGDFVRRATCRDTIEHVREESGQPPLDRRNGTEEDAAEPMLYRAVDHDVDGCDVLVMADNPDDVRPVPEGGPVVIQRADAN